MANTLSRLCLAALAVLGAGSAGCIPPGIAWLPDSSGFVYTGGKGKRKLLLFEVDKKKSRVLVADVGVADYGLVAWPGVSQDGKQIAVAWHFQTANHDGRMTVLVVDRSGKVVHRCRDLEAPLVANVLQVFWSPRGDKLLISEEFWARLYDLKTQKLTRLPGPAVTFGTSPIRPDGKAFLVHDWDEGYRLVDWDGKEQIIKPGYAGVVKKDDDERRGMLRFPLHFDSGWDGSVATVAGLGSRFRVDTNKLSLTEEAYQPRRTDNGEVVSFRHSFRKGPTVRVVQSRLEVIRPGKAPEVLVQKGKYCKFFPSPDGKYLAVRWAEDFSALFGGSKRENRVLVLDARGDVVADLKVGE